MPPARSAPPAYWCAADLRLSGARPAGWPDLQEGLIARLEVAPGPDVLHAARELTARCLADWGMPDLEWDAVTIVSELLTNAVTHAPPPAPDQAGALGMRLLGGRGALAIVVTDPGVRAPVLRRAPAEDDLDACCDLLLAEGGRGLHIVDGLSRAWGWAPLLTGGKAVWAVLGHAEPPR